MIPTTATIGRTNMIRRALAGALLASSALAAATMPATLHAQQPITHADSAAATPARPLSLGDAVDIAQKQSQVVHIANNAIQRAQGGKYQARSGLFPQLKATANYTRTLASQFTKAFSSGPSTAPSGPAG